MDFPSPPGNKPILTLDNDISIRLFQHKDIEQQIISLNDPEVRQYLRNTIPFPYTQANGEWWANHCSDETSWLRSGPWSPSQAHPEGDGTGLLPAQLAIDHAGMFIGSIGFTMKSDIYFRTAEIGYWLAKPYWGKGIMGKVVPAFVQWVFENFGVVWRIEGQVFEKNAASAKVLMKAGLKLEGVRQGAVWKEGRAWAESVYGVCREGEL